MTDLAHVLSEYGLSVLIVVLAISGGIFLFKSNQREKENLQVTLDRYRRQQDDRIAELEEFQKTELLEISKTLIATLEQNNRCMQDSAASMNKITEIIIIQRSKEKS